MRRFGLSFVYAFRGVKAAFDGQRNIVVQSCLGATALIAGYVLHVSRIEMMMIVTISGAIIALEMANTAIEKLVDTVSPGYDKKFGLIKDIMAGAVLVLALTSVVLGAMIFLPPLLALAD